MIDKEQIILDCERVRTYSPLVLNITNYVAMNISANALLAIGASPLMSFYEEEMSELTSISSALVVNIGCLDEQIIAAARLAAATAHSMGKPWVLDPVGVGASKVRTRVALELIEKYNPTIIRGNASEIMCLAGESIASRGVDATCSSSDAVEAARRLASLSGAVVSMSGMTDYITDGQRVESISNGSSYLQKITATGCSLSAITAAFAAVDAESLSAATSAAAVMALSGERAVARMPKVATGSLAVALIDELSTFDAGLALEELR